MTITDPTSPADLACGQPLQATSTIADVHMLHVITQGVLSEILLGPHGLSLNVGTHRVTFTGLGAFPPAGLDRLRGHAITITASAAGCYEIAGACANETILATTIAVIACPSSV